MKTILNLTILLAILIANNSFGQTIEKLDEKNGFKNFKLGDSKSSYEGKLVLWKDISDDDVTGYIYTGLEPDSYKVFDKTFSFIKLIFDNKDKLVGIGIVKKYESKDPNHYGTALTDNKELIQKFIAMFGDATGKVSNENTTELGLYWVSKNVYLKLTTRYKGIDQGSETEVMVFSNLYIKQKLNSGF